VTFDPVRTYDALLADEALAADSHERLEEYLRAENLVFGGRALCTVLRPRFVTPERHQALRQRVRAVMHVYNKTYHAAIANRDIRAQFRLHDWEETLVGWDPGIANPSPTSRLDTFLGEGPGEFLLTEYNAETPAGAGYNDALADAFRDIPVMRAFARKAEVFPLFTRHAILQVLLAAWEEFSGRRTRPRVAIIDWDDVPTQVEFGLFRRFFEQRGLPCLIGTPQECEYANGRFTVRGEPVDLIYKRVLIHELVQQGGLDHPIVRAVKDRVVCLVNGFRSKILHKKASLAVLSDEHNAHLFDPHERAVIHAHVPWTRVVVERHTEFNGHAIDLVPFIHERREELVLKPNDDYGGAGIVLGWTVDDAAWAAAVQRALAEPYIVQERVSIPRESYPSWMDGRVQWHDRQLDTAPFVSYAEQMDGYLTRLSTEALLNVTAGGGSQVPTFLVEPR
jgi:hypothetical protein